MSDVIEPVRRDTVFSFGPFHLVPHRQMLLHEKRPVKLGGRAFALLNLLVDRRGELVSKDDLMAAAWPDTFVHESNLKVNVHSLRRSLGDTQAHARYIATVAGRGYQFVAPVRVGAFDDTARSFVETTLSPSKPPLPDDIVGREDDVAHIRDELKNGRLVTVAGAGGIGKTTVAATVANALGAEFPDGTCFVDLAAIDDPAVVPSALVAALGLRGDPGDSLAAVVEHLRHRRMLVVLDNCEHVLPAAVLFAGRALAQHGPCRILATSREPLGLPSERVTWLDPLACAGPGDPLTAAAAVRYPAIALFARRALEWTGYQLTDDDCETIAKICRSLDGLPLAIELTASQLDRCTAHDLLAGLDAHPEFQTRHLSSAPARHATLLATIGWSYKLLSRNEAAIFRLISVFAGSFELEDVVAVATPAGLSAVEVATGLGGLVAKSLLTAQASGQGLRYRLLDSTRHFAADKLLAEPAARQARQAYANHILALLERSEGEWNWRETGEWTGCYLRRLADLRAALSWALGEDGEPALGIRLTAAALPLWFEASLVAEAQMRVRTALRVAQASPGGDMLKAKLACFLAWSMIYAHRLTSEIEAVWLDALSYAKRAGSVHYRLQALLGFSFYLMQTGNFAQAIRRLEEFRQISERHNEHSASPDAERFLAIAQALTGHLLESRQALEKLAATYAQVDRRSRMAGFQVDRYIGIRCYLSFVAWLTGHPTRAAAMARDAIAAAGDLNHRVSQSNVLAQAALPVSLWMGNLALVERYTMLLRSNLETENIAIWIPVHRFYEAALADARGDVDAHREMSNAIDALVDSGLRMRLGMHLGILAEMHARHGRNLDASEAIARAYDYQQRQNEHWCRPELRRVEAVIARGDGRHGAAERLLECALGDARGMGAMAFELRIANDLASLYVESDRQADAVRLLAPLAERFHEGFMTRDFRTTARLLRTANAAAA